LRQGHSVSQDKPRLLRAGGIHVSHIPAGDAIVPGRDAV
jgi:hypothetical protein